MIRSIFQSSSLCLIMLKRLYNPNGRFMRITNVQNPRPCFFSSSNSGSGENAGKSCEKSNVETQQQQQAVPKKPSMDINSYYKPILLFAVTTVGLYIYFKREQAQAEKRKFELIKDSTGYVGEAKIGGPFTLTNHQGKQVTEKDFEGKFMLLYFGFTHCPDICPDELDRMAIIIDSLDKDPSTRDKLAPVFVSVDPKRDTPEKMAVYLKDFHPKMVGLTGTLEQILSFAKLYRVYCSKNTETKGDEDYLVDHSVFFYLMGPHGKYVDFFGKEMSTEEISTKISQYIQKAKEVGLFMPKMDSKVVTN